MIAPITGWTSLPNLFDLQTRSGICQYLGVKMCWVVVWMCWVVSLVGGNYNLKERQDAIHELSEKLDSLVLDFILIIDFILVIGG
jgi:uncharacterized membrane protein YkvI